MIEATAEPYYVWAAKQIPHAMRVVIGFYLARTCFAQNEV